jgi:tight adherence protein C
MSETLLLTLVATLAAACAAAVTFAFAVLAVTAVSRYREQRPRDRVLCRHRKSLPLPIRLLRVLVAPLARRLDASLRRLPVAPIDRLLRRAGVSDLLSCSELLLLGLPLALLALPALVVSPRAAGGLSLFAALVAPAAFRWLRRTAGGRERLVLRELPFHLDMLALALESGSTLLLALRSCTPRAPPGPLRDAFEALAFDLQAGRLRSDALAALQRRVDFDSITALTTAVREADRSGAGLARVLRIQADQRRHERFHYAERRAMEAPVRMLGPLVLCIFPCTFIVIGFVLYGRVSG